MSYLTDASAASHLFIEPVWAITQYKAMQNT